MKEPKYCKKCGCYIPDDWNKCPACGFKFENPFGNLHPAEIPVHENLNPKSENENRNQNLKFRFDNSKDIIPTLRNHTSTIDAVTVVRCKDCKYIIYRDDGTYGCYRNFMDNCELNEFCKYEESEDDNYISYITNGTTYIMQGGDWFDTRRI